MSHKLPTGVVHKVPENLGKIILAYGKMRKMWEDITPLARNEWLCWIESAKRLETRNRRIKIMRENLTAGKHRPCCWAGYMHR